MTLPYPHGHDYYTPFYLLATLTNVLWLLWEGWRRGFPLRPWLTLVADKASCRLLLYAEMKLPGEAWLQFRIVDQEGGGHALEQLAAYRPRGLAGRLYWYSVLPFHGIIFKGMVKNLIRYREVPVQAARQPELTP